MEITSETSTVLDLPPSAVAFCPSHPEFYVVGTYFLHPKEDNGESKSIEASGEAPQKRTGTLILHRLEGSVFSHVQTVPLDSAVLDLEWTPHVALLGDLLCVATSTGSLEFYNFDSATARLEKHSSKQITEASTLVLDLLWHPSRADIIAVTLSDGAVSLCQSSVDDKFGSQPWSPPSTVATTELATHSLEPWTLAFSPDAVLLFSGGDDAVLQALKLPPIDTDTNARSEDDEDNDNAAATLLWADRKSHEAGVTSILPLADDLLITGSYDDRIRLLSAPAVGRRKVLAELDLGGGVWRLKMLESGDGQSNSSTRPAQHQETSSYTLLASCMHAGSRIVQLSRSGDEWEFAVLAKFEEHKSMNYGSDVQPLVAGAGGVAGGGDVEGREQQKRVVVSTSFYDKLMCVWSF